MIWREPDKEGIPPGRERVSPYDPDARWSREARQGLEGLQGPHQRDLLRAGTRRDPRAPEPDHQRVHHRRERARHRDDRTGPRHAPRPPGCSRRARRRRRLPLRGLGRGRLPAGSRWSARCWPTSRSKAGPGYTGELHHRLGHPAGDLPTRPAAPLEPDRPTRAPKMVIRFAAATCQALPPPPAVHPDPPVRPSALPAPTRGPRSPNGPAPAQDTRTWQPRYDTRAGVEATIRQATP